MNPSRFAETLASLIFVTCVIGLLDRTTAWVTLLTHDHLCQQKCVEPTHGSDGILKKEKIFCYLFFEDLCDIKQILLKDQNQQYIRPSRSTGSQTI